MPAIAGSAGVGGLAVLDRGDDAALGGPDAHPHVRGHRGPEHAAGVDVGGAVRGAEVLDLRDEEHEQEDEGVPDPEREHRLRLEALRELVVDEEGEADDDEGGDRGAGLDGAGGGEVGLGPVEHREEEDAGDPGVGGPQRNQKRARGMSSGMTFFFVSAS
jgi:hypothetical protein